MKEWRPLDQRIWVFLVSGKFHGYIEMHFLRVDVFCYYSLFYLVYLFCAYESHFNVFDLTYYPFVSCEISLSLVVVPVWLYQSVLEVGFNIRPSKEKKFVHHDPHSCFLARSCAAIHLYRGYKKGKPYDSH